jgi:hypothetical protein
MVWMFQGQLHHLLLHFLGDPVPDLLWVRTVIHQSCLTFLQI